MVASKAQQAATAERRAKAIRMKIDGASYSEIATALGYSSRSAAHMDVKRSLEKHVVEEGLAIEAWRELELARLDTLQQAIWGKAMSGDTRAIEAALKILDRRAKLLGLDSAIKLEVLTVDALDAQIQRLEAELNAAGIAPADSEVGETPPPP
ncbi:helix-turn-helix domain-containing protein [Streptomyces sp. S186]|uniref:helix-turn-helix domain-containing protein n=1 Tax=Streptomyces sp. S186 TaxID=3434395 RepID=UPI003F661D67